VPGLLGRRQAQRADIALQGAPGAAPAAALFARAGRGAAFARARARGRAGARAAVPPTPPHPTPRNPDTPHARPSPAPDTVQGHAALRAPGLPAQVAGGCRQARPHRPRPHLRCVPVPLHRASGTPRGGCGAAGAGPREAAAARTGRARAPPHLCAPQAGRASPASTPTPAARHPPPPAARARPPPPLNPPSRSPGAARAPRYARSAAPSASPRSRPPAAAAPRRRHCCTSACCSPRCCSRAARPRRARRSGSPAPRGWRRCMPAGCGWSCGPTRRGGWASR
jgi:hypothetical protein